MNEECLEHLPKDEQIKNIENEEVHPLDKEIASVLQEAIDEYIDFLSIDRNDLDSYAQAVIDVTEDVSRAIYKDGFEEELFNYINEGRAVFKKIKNLIESHPYTTRKQISNETIETTKNIYSKKTNDILERINTFIEDL